MQLGCKIFKDGMTAVVAMTRARVIGHRGHLPWHLPQDMRHFKAVTMGRNLVMGRKTWESIARPLKGRNIYVLTHRGQENWPLIETGVTFINAVSEAPLGAFICGGSEIYRVFWDSVLKIYLTRVKQDFQGDTFFPFDIDAEFSVNATIYEDKECKIETLERR